MKHITTLLLVISLVCVSCVKERWDIPRETDTDESKVTLNGSLSLPMADNAVWTKTFGEYSTDTRITHLYVAVFNEGDILTEVVEARPGTKEHPQENFVPGNAGNNYKTEFYVTLTKAPARKRILHFIGSSVERTDLLSANISDESTYSKTLIASDDEDCYWGRVEFEGLTEETDIRDIPLVRNFVKVKVVSEANKFEITSFKVFNIPTSGSIAPFNPNSPEYVGTEPNVSVNFNRFADYTRTGISYLNMSSPAPAGQYYVGYMPSGVTYDNLTTWPVNPANPSGPKGYDATGTNDATFVSSYFIPAGGADYLYEASHYENEKNPFIIIKGSYDGHADTYYKADFVYVDDDGDTQPYHLLRNFQYTLRITNVTGDGHDNIYEAVNGIALNNFEASTQSQFLTNISDGSTRLTLSTTDELIVRGASFVMYAKSEKLGAGATDDNANLSVKALKHVSGDGDVVASTSAVSIGATITDDNSEWKGWRPVTITITDPSTLQPGEVWKQIIVFKNKGDDGLDATLQQKEDDLTRNLTLTIRRPLSLSLDVQDYVIGVAGSECRVDFSIPAGLTEQRFPMDFYIEQEDNTLFPVYLEEDAYETLSVIIGKSMIPGNETKNTYYYKRTLSWEEYGSVLANINGIKTFSAYFRSLVDASKTNVWIFPAEKNDYFDINHSTSGTHNNQDTFENSQAAGAITFQRTKVVLSLDTGRTTTTNVATANSGAQITYTSDHPEVVTVGEHSGLLTAVSEGEATITATCDEYGRFTAASNTFTVRVIATGGMDIVWSTEPSRILIPEVTGSAVATVNLGTGTSLSGTITYTSSNPAVATIAADGTITAVSAGSTVIKAMARAAVGGVEGLIEQDVYYSLTVAPVGEVYSNTVYHDEPFTNGTLGDYTINNVSGTGPFDHSTIWYPSGMYGVAASSWLGTDPNNNEIGEWHDAEAWLISKPLDLRATDGAVLKFNHTANYFDGESATTVLDQMKECLTLWYSVNNGDWVRLAIPDDQYPAGTSWASKNTNIPLPAAVNGQPNVRIAFKYISGIYHGQWQIMNLTISEQ